MAGAHGGSLGHQEEVVAPEHRICQEGKRDNRQQIQSQGPSSGNKQKVMNLSIALEGEKAMAGAHGRSLGKQEEVGGPQHRNCQEGKRDNRQQIQAQGPSSGYKQKVMNLSIALEGENARDSTE